MVANLNKVGNTPLKQISIDCFGKCGGLESKISFSLADNVIRSFVETPTGVLMNYLYEE